MELVPVGNKGQDVRRGTFKWDTVEANLQVQHADPLSPSKLCPVPPCVIELVLALGHIFVNWDYDLAHPIGLPRLNACISSNGVMHCGCSPGKIGPITPLAASSSSWMSIQASSLGAVGWLCLAGHCIGEVQIVVVLWVPNPPISI